MLLLARLLTTGLFLWLLAKTRREALIAPEADIDNAWNFVLVILSGLLMSTTWAPLLGRTIASPISGFYLDGSADEPGNSATRLIRWCDRHRWRRVTRWLCFLEGIRHPELPAAFVIGLRNSIPGSWLEKVYAREVFRFDNVARVVDAMEILQVRHGVNPGAHPHLEVRLNLLARERVPHPPTPTITLTAAPPPPPLKRNERIKLPREKQPDAENTA